MTTAAETLEPHFAAIAHQLGRIADALECGSTSHSPKKAPVAENSPSRESPAPERPAVSAERVELGPLYCWCEAPTVKAMVGIRMRRVCTAEPAHDPEHRPKPAPTVGQLSAQHIGNQVTVGSVEIVPDEIEHYADLDGVTRTRIKGDVAGQWIWSSGTPCTVIDDEASTTPAAYDAPDTRKPWRDIREALAEHRYRGASQSVCTCGWTHAGRVDPVGEWLDHVTDVILDELGLA